MRGSEVKPFASVHINSVPEIEGIYVIYDETAEDLPVYVGRSNNIRNRLRELFIGCGSKTIDLLTGQGHDLWFSFGYSNNPYSTEAAELARLSPAGNKKRVIKYLEEVQG
ncbi:MAG: GIY-YIG nuclease family protein [Nodosilinea sp. WJT8-NPBG4]|jgi:hypothetical protein|nr:GIY-YIG nuclease family protein [Nodosilinea sp. WJT8-NPBG4]